MPEFPIIPSRTAMLFFDTLNHYLHPADPKAKQAIDELGVIPRMQRMHQACREAGIAVFYAQADHRPDHRDFAPHVVGMGYDGRPGEEPRLTTPPPVSVAGGAREVIPELAPQSADYVIRKHRWSTFFQTHFELSLRTAGIDTIIMAGGAVEVGVASTAYSARDRDFNQIILRDACTSGKPQAFEVFMDQVFPIFARVMTVDQAIALIRK